MSLTYKHIRRRLTDASTVRGSIYAFETPVKQKPPFVAFFLNDLDAVFTKDKASPLGMETWTLISYDMDVDDAITNANACRTLLDHYAGTLEGVTVKQSIFLNRNIPLVESDEEGNKIFEVVDTYEMRV